MTITRAWAMPSPDTFTIPPVGDLLDRWLAGRRVVVDPFARNSRRGTITNDLDASTTATDHLPADLFAANLESREVQADAILLDPPYSPRQLAECYRGAGMHVGQKETQNAGLLARLKDSLANVLLTDGVAISFGWNSTGFGKGRGFELVEVLMVAHGGAHNDTIVTVEVKRVNQGRLFAAGSEVA